MVKNYNKLGHGISFRLSDTSLYESKKTYRITSNERPWSLFNFQAFCSLKQKKTNRKNDSLQNNMQ